MLNVIRVELKFKSLELICNGHYEVETSSQLTSGDVNKFVRHAINISDLIIKSKLFATLNIILKYGEVDMWRNSVNLVDILDELHKTIKRKIMSNDYNIEWRTVSKFYRDLLLFLQKEVALSTHKVKKGITDSYHDSAQSFHLSEDGSSSNRERLSRLYALNLRLEQAQKERSLFHERNEKFLFEHVMDKEELALENKELCGELDRLKTRISERDEELDRLRRNLQEKSEELEDCRQREAALCMSLRIDSAKQMTQKVEAITLLEEKKKLDFASSSEDDTFLNIFQYKESAGLAVADDFVEFLRILRAKRENITDFRQLICGSLKHLGANLYSSPLHFLSEIIQNFEDSQYADKVAGTMKLVVDGEYLLFMSNEVGFRAKDVMSICSCAESTKQAGKHTGNKGLGFKSVFLCSDTPMIYSKPHWRFGFRAPSSKLDDEIAYLSPLSLREDEIPAAFRDQIAKNHAEFTTFVYLPLKEIYTHSETRPDSRKYFEELVSNLNPNVLLFTRNIKKILVEDNLSRQVTVIESSKKDIICDLDKEVFDCSILLTKSSDFITAESKENLQRNENNLRYKFRIFSMDNFLQLIIYLS